MAAKASSLIVGVFLWMISFQSLALVVNGDQDLIQKLCGVTTATDFCIECVTSDPSSSTATDTDIVGIAMTCAAKKMDLLTEDSYKAKQGTSDPVLKEVLAICNDRVEDAKTLINGVSAKVKSRHFKGAKEIISKTIMVKVNSCNELAESEGTQLPPVVYNDVVTASMVWGDVVLKMLNVLH